MSSSLLTRFRNAVMLGAIALLGLPGLAIGAYTSSQFSSLPVTAGTNSTNSTPLVMLLLGKDDSLYKKAYTDLVDLTGNDGLPQTTYTNSINYYGYFNSAMCYTYDATNGYFTPAASTTNHLCTGSAHKYWSGNFLNWATMTRMDILRKVLYGGYRSTDTASKTVLERAYFPTDAHSFAKVYSGSDLGDLTPFDGSATTITICNSTPAASGDSQDVTNPPLMRVANGDFSKWAANERWQCTWDGEKTVDAVSAHSPNDNDPDKSADGLTSNGAGPDYNVRVEVCDNNVLNASNCTKYTDASGTSDYKPTGLLQTYGETGKIKFGLMTGSYTKSKSGGVLRKNISDFSNEVDPSNGTFTNVNGIVSTINALRVHGYNNKDGLYNNDDSCKWGLSSFTEPNCSNWGNPISEMYLEAVRYFNGQKADSDFSTDDSSYIPGVNGVPGLSTATWSPPLNKDNYCAKCSIIVLNTGPFSYDSDQIDSGFGNLNGGTPSAETLTNYIGDWEGITGNDFFIGDNGTASSNTGLCTSKTISSLSQALGPCPDSPRLGGSYDIAGIAYWAHTNNVNSSSGIPANADQTVNTYAVSLSSTTPVVNIPVPGSSTQTVKLMPACRNTGTSTATDCRIVDMQITKPYTLVSGTATGQIYVNWEDSEQGGDFDQDMWGTIDYSIDSSGITITTQVSYQSTSYPMGFGYVISGTTNDGFHVTSGIYSFSYTDSSISNSCGSTGNTCTAGAPATKVYYPLGSTTAGILKDPLWYAAKYGGFTGYSTSTPAGTDPITSSAQWDNRNNSTNAIGSDGLPDNYFNSSNPGNLETNLGQVLANITEQVSAGTAAAVVANSGSGAGMIVQALYQPLKTNSKKYQRVTWVGRLYSLFVDNHNNLREDSNQNGQLDDYATDKVVSIVYDKSTNQTQVAVYTTPNGIDLTLDHLEPLSNLKPIWSARDQLAAISNSSIPTQRNYTDTIDSTHGRYIFTWIDSNNDGVVDSNEVIPFTDQSITSSNYGWLDLQSDFNGDNTIDVNDADDLVNFIRGEDGIDNFRSRTIDYDGSGNKVWRLGDIIHSTPLIVGAPSSDWDDKYGDTSYTAFKKQYASRRVVVYSGANDGMLHAFNSGFYDSLNKKYCIAPLAVPSGSPAGTPATCPSNATGDPLGSELWGYVPGNLLPHLQWLAEKDYPHVYYVDGTPQAFDVNIFPDDATHPGGWGTILVVGMRLGGGEMDYTPISGTNVKARSAYVIMDITDPEQPPKLLGEISDPSLGFTTSTPSLMVRRAPGTGDDWTSPTVNDWYLVFGSGPTDLSTVTSTQNASLYVLNLKSMQFVKGFPEDLKIANSFVGDVNSIDWTNDYKTDAAYFGIVGGSTSTPTGQLMRMVLTKDTNNASGTYWPVSTVINPSQPFVNRPEFAVDDQNNWWVYDGTGRLYVSGDAQSTEQQSFYGIKEQVDSSTRLPSGTTAYRTSSGGSYYLQNTTGVQVGIDGTIYDINGVLPSTVTNFYGSTGLISDIAGKAGWYINLVPDTANTPANPITATGSERNLGNSLLFRQLMLFTTFTPNSNVCTFDGSSKLYGVYYKTGTAYPNAGLGNKTCSNCATGVEVSASSIDLAGATTTGGVILSVGSDNAKMYLTGIHGQGFNPPVTGVPTPTGRQSWREIIPQ